MSNLKKKLAAAKNAFAKARKNVEENPAGSGEFFDEVGRFDTQVSGGEINESQNGRLQAYIEFTILDGEFKGESFRSYYGLDKDVSIEILLKDIARLGFEAPEDVEELEDKIEEIVKAKPKIKIKRVQKGEYTNNYLQKLMDEGDDTGDDAGAESSGDDDAQAADAPEFTPEAGAEVTTPDGDGTVKSVDADDKDAVVKLESGDKKTYPWADLKPKGEAEAEAPAEPEAPADEGGGDIDVGQTLLVEDPKQKINGLGKVTKLHADEGEVSLKMEKGGKVVRVGVDKLSLPPEPAPAKKAMRVGKK